MKIKTKIKIDETTFYLVIRYFRQCVGIAYVSEKHDFLTACMPLLRSDSVKEAAKRADAIIQRDWGISIFQQEKNSVKKLQNKKRKIIKECKNNGNKNCKKSYKK